MLQEMTRKKKIGVLMSLHELDLAERVSDKIVCVKGENIDHYGTPEEVFTDGFVDQLYEITDGTFQEKNGCVELKKCGGIPEVFVIAGMVREVFCSGSFRETGFHLQWGS